MQAIRMQFAATIQLFPVDSREELQPTCRTAQYRAFPSIQSTSCRGRSQINCCKAAMSGSSWRTCRKQAEGRVSRGAAQKHRGGTTIGDQARMKSRQDQIKNISQQGSSKHTQPCPDGRGCWRREPGSHQTSRHASASQLPMQSNQAHPPGLVSVPWRLTPTSGPCSRSTQCIRLHADVLMLARDSWQTCVQDAEGVGSETSRWSSQESSKQLRLELGQHRTVSASSRPELGMGG